MVELFASAAKKTKKFPTGKQICKPVLIETDTDGTSTSGGNKSSSGGNKSSSNGTVGKTLSDASIGYSSIDYDNIEAPGPELEPIPEQLEIEPVIQAPEPIIQAPQPIQSSIGHEIRPGVFIFSSGTGNGFRFNLLDTVNNVFKEANYIDVNKVPTGGVIKHYDEGYQGEEIEDDSDSEWVPN